MNTTPLKSTTTAALLLCVTANAHADFFTWNKSDGGNFNTASNWSPAGGPPNDILDIATFNLTASYNVQFQSDVTNNSLNVNAGTVNLRLLQSAIPVSFRHNYSLAASGTSMDVSSAPGAAIAAKLAVIGRDHTTDPTALKTTGAAFIGFSSNEKGTVDISNTQFNVGSTLTVGFSGEGTFDVDDGSTVTAQSTILGRNSSGSGTANIDGRGLIGSGGLIVAERGTATLNLDGPSANIDTSLSPISIAEETGSNGTIRLTEGAELNAGDTIYVGGGPAGPGGTALLSAPNSVFPFADKIESFGDLVVYPNGTVNVALDDGIFISDDIILSPGASFTLNSSTTLIADRITGAPDTFTWNSGHIETDELVIDANNPLGETEHLSNLETLITGTLKVGPTAPGTLTVVNTDVTASTVEVGTLTPTTASSTLEVSGSTSDLLITNELHVRGTELAMFNVINKAPFQISGPTFIAGVPATQAAVKVTGIDTNWYSAAPVYVAGNADTPGGTATFQVNDDALMEVDDHLKLWPGAMMNVDDAVLSVSGNLDVLGSLILTNAHLGISSTTDVNVSGNLHIESSFFDIPQLNIADTGFVTFMNHIITVDSTGAGNIERLSLDGGTLYIPVGNIRFATTSLIGNGIINGAVFADKGVVANGDLTLGRSDISNTVRIGENNGFLVSDHHVTINQKNFWGLHPFTIIGGGTLSAPNGIVMAPTRYLAAYGTVDAPMFVHGGATIEADGGNLTVGDLTALNGFFSDGIIETGPNTVTILDANQAVLGTLTTLGDATTITPGTLAAPNGLLLEFGKDIQGYGTIDTPNDPATPLTNFGHIAGNSPAEPITLNGYIKGIGTFANVVINGTLSPGLSPGVIYIEGDLTLADNATTIIELAGPEPGTEHDQLNITHTLNANGQLTIKLLSDYHPTPGTTYNLFNFASATGTFATINLPTLHPALSFDTTKLLTTGTLTVIPEPSTFALLPLAVVLCTRRPTTKPTESTNRK